MNYRKDQYQNYKIGLSKLLKENGLKVMSKDSEVIDRIFNLLTENKSIYKIEGLISATEVIKYGGDIEDIKTKSVFNEILDWWEENKL